MNTPAPLLEVRNLKKWYDVRRSAISGVRAYVKAVDDVSFSIRPHEVLGLAGESGSGKTTIGRAVLRLIEPTAGDIRFDGVDVVQLNRRDLRKFRRKAQIVFQDPFSSLDPRMTIQEIVGEPFQVQGMGLSRSQRQERVIKLLDTVSLSTHYLRSRPHELSGGQRQRVGIARALAVEPTFLVADEPVSALDVSIQAQVVNLLDELRERFGLAMLFISHDIAVMEHLSDRIAVIYLGKIMEIGPTEEIVHRPKHPYTEALLSAVPDPSPALKRKRIVLQGDIPNPADPPSGCVFRTRCPYALPACATTVPPLRGVGAEHATACIREDIL